MAKSKGEVMFTAPTPSQVIKLMRHPRRADRLAALKEAGIVTNDGKLARRYQSWGKKRVARTSTRKTTLA